MENGNSAKLKFSARLREWRSQQADDSGEIFSQEKAAEHLGVNLNSYRKWEQGCVLPRAEVAMELDARMRKLGI